MAAGPVLTGTAGVVLAAGGGSRFGGDAHKLLHQLWGKPLVAWAVEAAVAAGLDGVVVVGGAVDLAPLLPAEATLVVNPSWSSGQASSLWVGLDWCAARGCEAAVVGLGDQPLVPPETWRAVGACATAPIVAARYGGRRRNPVRLARSVWPQLPRDGDEGARVVMAGHPELVVELDCEGDPVDVDTLEDLRTLEARQAAR